MLQVPNVSHVLSHLILLIILRGGLVVFKLQHTSESPEEPVKTQAPPPEFLIPEV